MTDSPKNTRLIHFDDLKDAVVANAVKNVPQLKKAKATASDRQLGEFS